ncbi:EAL domain-containing protein [Methylobacterium terricola]|uniref:EAL domain-containing protein n=1 Tax=Methylobacterium terricola TaxID=2583531 RepID=A0A5C4L8X8_9HYPH|nr:EAL domain-containing protein [Methylobacterium terricola]TNC07454.1 EAL domain-containing protein [Methylobacterium terricola]
MMFERRINADLVLPRYYAFATKMPPLYAFLAAAMLAVMVLFRGREPVLASLAIPAFLMAMACIRGWWWYRHRDDAITTEQAQARLTRAIVLLVGAAILAVVMVLSLSSAASAEEKQFLSLICVLAGLVGLFCLSNLRYVAVLCTAVTLFPAVVQYFSAGTMPAMLSGLVLLLAVASLACSLTSSYDEFTTLVRSKLEIQQLDQENVRLLSIDMVTGIPNRRFYFDALSAALAAKDGAGTMSVGVIDLDGFKPVNDSYGHRVGDAVLREVAQRLSEAVPQVKGMSRIGGDEFAFYLDSVTDPSDLMQIGQALIEATQHPLVVGDLTVSVSCSIGFATYPESARQADILFEYADFALYHAKRTGRSRSEIFSAEHRALMSAEDSIEQALRGADLQTELTAMFQPVVDMVTGRVLAFECLARWNSPTLGSVSPSAFIPTAERTGLITPITLAMLDKALIEMRTWPPSVKLSFNLSSNDITSQLAVLRIVGLLAKSGIPPSRVIFELTETALLHDFSTARANIERIKATGAQIALDDFGTGYSSLSHIQNLPLNKLKIDRRFVLDIETNETSRMIVRALVSICEGIGIDCIVEGVESEGQARTLGSLGCNVVQGYLYSRPIRSRDIPGLLTRLAPADAISA